MFRNRIIGPQTCLAASRHEPQSLNSLEYPSWTSEVFIIVLTVVTDIIRRFSVHHQAGCLVWKKNRQPPIHQGNTGCQIARERAITCPNLCNLSGLSTSGSQSGPDHRLLAHDLAHERAQVEKLKPFLEPERNHVENLRMVLPIIEPGKIEEPKTASTPELSTKHTRRPAE